VLDASQIAEVVRTRDGDPEVSASTLHYYVQVGILPPAVGRGRSGYTPEHLSRFRLARRLKRQGIGLADIRERLTAMNAGDVAAEMSSALAQPELAQPAPTPRTQPEPTQPAPTSRTLRFRGGYSLQVPAGTPDERIARLYAAIEALLEKEKQR
jgi:DNA-binding transcriptional MerR regulator